MTKTDTNIQNAFDNKSVVSAKYLEENGFERYDIDKYLQNGILEKVGYGMYCLKSNSPDEYAIIQSRSEKIIYSHSTAMFLLGISDRIPNTLEITIPQGYNVSKIKRDYPNTNFYYTQADIWGIGITQVTTPQGFEVTTYDKERSILDIIKHKNKIDAQIYTQAIKQYFSTQKNFRKLLKYSKLMKMEDKVRVYIELFQ